MHTMKDLKALRSHAARIGLGTGAIQTSYVANGEGYTLFFLNDGPQAKQFRFCFKADTQSKDILITYFVGKPYSAKVSWKGFLKMTKEDMFMFLANNQSVNQYFDDAQKRLKEMPVNYKKRLVEELTSFEE